MRPMKLELKHTQRGFSRAEFTDEYGEQCSIQDSSIATEACVWLGVDHVNGSPARMHLTVDMAAALIPLLQRFVETGSIGE